MNWMLDACLAESLPIHDAWAQIGDDGGVDLPLDDETFRRAAGLVETLAAGC